MTRTLIGLFAIGFFLFALTGCTAKQETEEQAVRPKWEDYQDKVQQTLFELATAKDHSKYAKQHPELEYAAMVRVVIRLKPDATLPEGFVILEESRYENEIQAWIPLEKLLELSQQPQIEYISVPRKPKLYSY